MPVLKILSNNSILNTEELLKKASTLLSEVLGKPEKYIMISYEVNQDMILGGTDDPLLYIELKSIGFPENRAKVISKKLTELLSQETGTTADRMYIEFSNADGSMWGWNGSTF